MSKEKKIKKSRKSLKWFALGGGLLIVAIIGLIVTVTMSNALGEDVVATPPQTVTVPQPNVSQKSAEIKKKSKAVEKEVEVQKQEIEENVEELQEEIEETTETVNEIHDSMMDAWSQLEE